MNVNIKWDERAFQKLIENEVRSGVQAIARDYTREFDRLTQRFKGQSVEEIKPHIHRLVQQNGGNISEPELTEWAEQVSNGTKIDFTAK